MIFYFQRCIEPKQNLKISWLLKCSFSSLSTSTLQLYMLHFSRESKSFENQDFLNAFLNKSYYHTADSVHIAIDFSHELLLIFQVQWIPWSLHKIIWIEKWRGKIFCYWYMHLHNVIYHYETWLLIKKYKALRWLYSEAWVM